MVKKIESKTALSVVLIIVNALVILPIIDHLGIGLYNAFAVTLLSIGVFLYDNRKGDLNNSFLSSLVFLATMLTLDNAYNAIYLSLPMYKQALGAFILIVLFFYTPNIVRYVLVLFKNHPIMLLVSGRVIAIIAAIGTLAFIYLKLGFDINLGALNIQLSQGWTFWQIFVLTWIVIHFYLIWRNKRELTANHRFLYNAVALYLLSLIMYIGYIRDYISFG